jgi:hypothetical protein
VHGARHPCQCGPLHPSGFANICVCVLVMKNEKAFHNAQFDDDNIDFDALEADLGGDIDDNDNADTNDNDEDAAAPSVT